MQKPTHKSVIKESIDEIVYEKPNKKLGHHSNYVIQAPNHKSETIKGGYIHTNPIQRKLIKNKTT